MLENVVIAERTVRKVSLVLLVLKAFLEKRVNVDRLAKLDLMVPMVKRGLRVQ